MLKQLCVTGSIRHHFNRTFCTASKVSKPEVKPRKRIEPIDVTFDADKSSPFVILNNTKYIRDEWTNMTPRMLSQVQRNLHLQEFHPLCHVKKRIIDFMYKTFPSRTKSPLFSVFEDISPIVTIEQNFDSLLVPKDHVSRAKNESYFFNKDYLLRAHTSAHQFDLIRSGLNNFLVIGDVYRRDEINKSHYPIFHQIEGVRLCGPYDVFPEQAPEELSLFEKNPGKVTRTPEKQETHTADAVLVMQDELKCCLTKLAHHLFGDDVQTRWVDAYFPFTHPSWELEIQYEGEWIEVLGCGIMEQEILKNAGAGEKMGWAFGLGLERLAMKLYQIPDIRVFWSLDTGILHQFRVKDPYTPIKFKAVSVYPQCYLDMSFWLPDDNSFKKNDFYDLVRSIGGDTVEQVFISDEFLHPKNNKWSNTFRIIYRRMDRTLTNSEANVIHREIEQAARRDLRVVMR